LLLSELLQKSVDLHIHELNDRLLPLVHHVAQSSEQILPGLE
jgi:hypothetical protein